MSTATLPTSVRPPFAGPPSLARLVRVELRKAVDTRSGFWLLVVLGLLAAGVVVVMLLVAEPHELTFRGLHTVAQLPVVLLLPVVGILAVTSEWSHRTATTTFTLVPQRERVVAAKVVAAVLLALLLALATLAVAAVGNLAGTTFAEGDGGWAISTSEIGMAALLLLSNVVAGVGFGLLLLNSALAIVLFFLLPTLFGILGTLVSALAGPARWLDFSGASGALLEGDVSAEEWAQLATSYAVWGLLPLALGTWRVLRSQVS